MKPKKKTPAKRPDGTASTALATRPAQQSVAYTPQPGETFLERLTRDQSIDVGKLERLMQLWERTEAKKAEGAYNAAMSTAQAAMRPVLVDSDNPQTHSRYASYEALDNAIRPIYTAHGFGLSFNTDDTAPVDAVRVLCKVSHNGGHAERFALLMPADGKGAKGGDVMTRTHATGSALSYGRRYLLGLIFNVAVAKDDDGNGAAPQPQRKPRAHPPARPVPPERESVPSTGQETDEGDELISNFVKTVDGKQKYGQAQRLMVLIRKSGRTPEEVKAWLAVAYSIDSTKKIPRRLYEEICDAVQSPGKLPPPRERQPGEDD